MASLPSDMPVEQPGKMAASANAEANVPLPQKKDKGKRAKEKGRRTLLRALVSIVIIAVGVYLLLLVVSWAAHYDSIGSMLNHMYGEAMYMWENRTTT